MDKHFKKVPSFASSPFNRVCKPLISKQPAEKNFQSNKNLVQTLKIY